MADGFSLSTDAWDLHRRAERDRARHQEKVREIVRERLGEVVSREDIITADGQKIVRVPVRGLELPRLRFDPNQGQRVGQGPGGTKEGDVLARENPDDKATGREPGQEPGVDFYDAEFTLDEIAAMVYEDLHLPNLEEKGTSRLPDDRLDFNRISRRGMASNIDRKRTLAAAIRRRARSGETGPLTIRDEDRRFRDWEETPEPCRNAVIFAMRDISGSMGEEEAYLCRAFFFWMLRFLRTRYDSCEIVFVTCHTQAREVDEAQFFSAGESGGTRMSSAYSLALQIIEKRFNPRDWNIYPFLFSDGYNWGDQECVDLVRKLLAMSNLIGYGEIATGAWYEPDGDFAPLGKAYAEAFATEPRVVLAKLATRDDVWPALKRFFDASPQRA